jgi:hypothetical protein
MSNYVQSTNFATKDSLSPGDPLKIVKGTEINTEFVNIAVAVATKADLVSPSFTTPLLGTPTSGTLTNCTGLPVATGVSGLGTGVATALAVNVGSAGAPVVNGGALGTPSSGTLTNATGLPLTTGVTGTLPVANGGTGVTTSTGSGAVVRGTSPTLTTPTIDSAQFATVSGTAPLYACRAWVNFDGTKDTTGATSTANTNRLIRASGNVASVLRNGTGDFTVTFTTAMSDANFVACVNSTRDVGYPIPFINAQTSSSVRINTTQFNSSIATPIDPTITNVVILR